MTNSDTASIKLSAAAPVITIEDGWCFERERPRPDIWLKCTEDY